MPRLLLILSVMLASAVSHAQAQEEATFRVAKINGAAKRSHIDNRDHFTELKVKDELKVGDMVLTTKNVEVDLETQDGSRILVTQNTLLEIRENAKAVQSLYLHRGKVAGSANKQEIPQSRGPKLRPYRFLIETKTGTMGVRGTQFVVESTEEDGGKSSFYVIEGVVDVAKDVASLLTDNVVVAQAGQLVTGAGKGVEFVAGKAKGVTTAATDWVDGGIHGLSAAMPFDVFGYLANLNSHLPDEFHIPFLKRPKPEEESAIKKEPPTFRFATFELYSQGYFSTKSLPSSRESHGLGLSWNPTYRLENQQYDLRFHLGLPRLFTGAREPFNNWELKVLATRVTRSILFFEGGPILQLYRGGELGAGLSVTTGIWFGDHPLFRMLDRFFFGVNWMSSPFPSLEYRFGVGIRFY